MGNKNFGDTTSPSPLLVSCKNRNSNGGYGAKNKSPPMKGAFSTRKNVRLCSQTVSGTGEVKKNQSTKFFLTKIR